MEIATRCAVRRNASSSALSERSSPRAAVLRENVLPITSSAGWEASSQGLRAIMSGVYLRRLAMSRSATPSNDMPIVAGSGTLVSTRPWTE